MTVTVRQLLEALRKVKNKDRIVIVASDAEGNRMSPLYLGDPVGHEAHYRSINTWEGEIISEDELYESKDGDQDAYVLYPTH